MMKLLTCTAVVLVLVAVAVFGHGATAAPSFRGAKPQDLHRYEDAKDKFTCFDGSASIPVTAINDDFCDCADGSDEPGTSACSNGQFYCANKLHTPLLLRSTRVNDGVCDCCDGTDEYNGLILCENTCEEAGRAAREEAERMRRVQREGFAQKQTLIQQGQQAKQEKAARKAQLEQEVEEVARKVDDLEQKKMDVETPEREAKEKFDATWKETVAAQANRAKRWLFDLLDINKDAVITLEEAKQHPEFDEDKDGAVSEEELMSVFDDDDDSALSDEEAQVTFEFFTESIYPDIKSRFSEREGAVKEHTDADKPPYDEDIQALISAAEEARQAFTAAENQRLDLQRELETIEKHLGFDVGHHSEFFPLLEECFDIVDREYRYKLCMFDRVTQEPKNGGRSTSLGSWQGWETEAGQPNYSQATFAHGEKCWNGPERSTQVMFVCGTETKVVEVGEPNRCEYMMRVETPAACAAPTSEGEEGRQHDEL
ncbi:hypothetical protein PTSG_01048 [Salpingoeca rosetta]|uniref:Glucosidase 2 subunit beta n=1 Tax=Salpingoeca rosetta (strain ATCC 50818 / BSB-021) TaxID=946362 RepID=F2TY89_SALR5|nr:uncharacterized protein PTSG_01048 [Salpingoeca rosetta]EGD76348.1 hypothetical protein PTSG_01048 [Salpingoeca rosetta]|eukprot:XP_004998523.1 hypothetical protein PTSG_01048 [Salpingoeca rosetta]